MLEMASSDNQFLRSSPERSSRSHINSGAAPDQQGVEAARQRALAAADYYHRTVGKSVSGSSGHMSDSDRMAAEPMVEPGRINGTHAKDGDRRDGHADPDNTNADYYKQKLRAGYIDLRNSYNEKSQPRYTAYSRNGAGPSAGDSAQTQRAGYGRPLEGSVHPSDRPQRDREHESKPPGYSLYQRTAVERRGLYRSNSSLELEHIDYTESDPTPLHRDYGSANSLDIMSTGGESFFALLQDYHNDNPDQRAPAPPHMQDVLRGRGEGPATTEPHPRLRSQHPPQQPQQASVGRGWVDERSGNAGRVTPPKHTVHTELDSRTKISNGALPIIEDDPSSGGVGEPPGSPRLRSKSQKNKDRKQRSKTMASEGSGSGSGGGLFKKFRGSGKTDSSDSNSKSIESTGESTDGIRPGDRLKRKAFVHYDCQSIGITIPDIIQRRSEEATCATRRNMTTGASAASGIRVLPGIEQFQDSMQDSQEQDPGDGQSNDLVLSCPFFRNELGGEEEQVICLNRQTAGRRVQQLLSSTQVSTDLLESRIRPAPCNGVAVLDSSPDPHGVVQPAMLVHKGLVLEYVDHGAFYYRHFFNGIDHHNFFGIDDQLGPLAVSVRREKLDEKERETPTGHAESAGHCYQYRLIVRTSELTTLRGSILEEAIPSSSRLSSTRGLPPKEVLEYVLPELPLSCLRQATPGSKTSEQLMKLDEQGITKNYKIGIMYCREGQSTEEEMYNNEHAGPAFEEFLQCIGKKVRLKGFDKYRGGLDVKTDSTGTHSLYWEVGGCEVMYHVSTMLPFTASNRQQLLRKRHIGNDIVTIVFQDVGAAAFTPMSVRSHFQHVFIIVRVHNPNTDNIKYSVAVSRSKDVPTFGPRIPDGALFKKSADFAEFLCIKAINAENAVHRSEKFSAMATRTRQEYLKDLAKNFVTTTQLDSSSRLSKFSLGSGRRKEKSKTRTIPDLYTRAAITWRVEVDDFGSSTLSPRSCHLAVSGEVITVTSTNKDVLFTTTCKSVIAWTSQDTSLRLYYNHGEVVHVQLLSGEHEEVQEVASRLAMVTRGSETQELSLRRNGMGQLGFHVHQEGVVWEVENYSYAWKIGLRPGSRLVEICKVATATLTHEQMVDLLRTSVTVKVVVVPPHEDGSPRRGCDELSISHLNLHPAVLTTDHMNTSSASSGGGSSNRYDLGDLTQIRPPARSRSQYRLETPQPVPLEARHSHSATSIVHSKQASRDSGESRSSNHSSEGTPGLQGHGSRRELRAADSIPVPMESQSASKLAPTTSIENTNPYRVSLYREREREYQNVQSLSPRTESNPTQWFEDGNNNTPQSAADPHGDSGYHSNNSTLYNPHPQSNQQQQDPLNPTYPGDIPKAYPKHHSPNARTAIPFNYGHQHHQLEEEPKNKTQDTPPIYRNVGPGSGLLGPPSMSNLSQNSDLSSPAVGAHAGTHSATSNQPPQPPTRGIHTDILTRGDAISPAGRQRQSAFTAKKTMDPGSGSSNNTSPRSSRNLSGISSEENLSWLARGQRSVPNTHQGASQRTSPPKSSPGGSGSTFQEDLIRLINPDVSFGAHSAEEATNKSNLSFGSGGGSSREGTTTRRSRPRPRDAAPGALHRTYSDESMCGAVTARSYRGNKHHPHRNTTIIGNQGSDVIFALTTPTDPPAGAARVADISADGEEAHEHKLSPRATVDRPGTLIRVRTTTATKTRRQQQTRSATTEGRIPPEDATGLAWNNLLDAANAFASGGDLSTGKSSSLGDVQHETISSSPPSSTVTTATSTIAAASSPYDATAASIKGAEVMVSGHISLHASRSHPNFGSAERERQTAGRTHSAPWRAADASGDTSQRVQDLEARIGDLETQLEREHNDRVGLEREVLQLQQDNIRLQEESQTAAAQLRKFTEWFFNTIDRQ